MDRILADLNEVDMPPVIGPLAQSALDAVTDLGVDANGAATMVEKCQWLDEMGVRDERMRMAFLGFWRAYKLERGEIRAEEREEAKSD